MNRKTIFLTYGNIFNLNFEDIEENILKFRNFNEFFTRKIRARKIGEKDLVILNFLIFI